MPKVYDKLVYNIDSSSKNINHTALIIDSI